MLPAEIHTHPLTPDHPASADPWTAPHPLLAVAREWSPFVMIAFALFLGLATWISCSKEPPGSEPGRFQMLLDKDGQVIVLDTATGETQVRAQHSKQPLP